MHWIDWVIVCVPLVVVIGIGLKSQRYIKGVSDFLTAGRVAGRYVVCVASGEAGLGLISLVAIYEAMYNSGFAYGFWSQIGMPIAIIMGLTGYCVYRFRETRAMTMGQFLEIRYSRKFRLLAAVLQSISGILNYALFPAVGARFLIYFCDLPLYVNILGWMLPTFALVMALFLGLAVLVACMGGQITIMVTDCVQGLLSYPMYAIIMGLTGYCVYRFRETRAMTMGQFLEIRYSRKFRLLAAVLQSISGILNYALSPGGRFRSVGANSLNQEKCQMI